MNHPSRIIASIGNNRLPKVILVIILAALAYVASSMTNSSGTVSYTRQIYGMSATGIEVAKQTLPAGNTTRFSYSGLYTGTLADGETAFVFTSPGMFSVTEFIPNGWLLNDIVCNDNDSSGDMESATATYIVADGESVRCTFINQLPSEIIVEKITDPAGEPQTFNFTTNYGQGFQLGHGQNNQSGDLLAGTYWVSESPLAGWFLDSATCDDGSDPSAIGLGGGETVTCTFVNQKAGAIIVKKMTNPAGHDQLFAFSTDYGQPFQLSHGQSNNSGALVSGTYSVTETLPNGWKQDSATCDDGSDPSAIDLAAGETVTCTFVNVWNPPIYLPYIMKESN